MNFTCPFCDKRCFKPYYDAEQWDCLECKTTFWDSRDGLKMSLIARIKDKKYKLDIDFRSSISRLYQVTELFLVIEHPQTIWEDEDLLLIKFPYAIERVNPTNVADKIRTILTFL